MGQLTFQVLPRLSASFRYSNLYDLSTDPAATEPNFDFVFDRSLSLSYRLLDESAYRPALAVGVNDFLGTSFYSSEYLVASKHLTENFRITGGLGWGRLGGVNSFANPLGFLGDEFDVRGPRTESNTGGEVDLSNLFRGPAALFGGVEWQVSDRLAVIAEYSSDDYPYEDGFSFDQRTPFNFGLTYQLTDSLNVAANYLYGSELGVRLTYAINPKSPRYGSGIDTAPPPVVPRQMAAAATWSPERTPTIRATTASALTREGIELHGFDLDAATARVEIENPTYPAFAQAIGRTARVLAATLPASVESFEVVLVERGVAVTSVTLRRRDLEELEFDVDGAWASYTRARFEDEATLQPLDALYPRFDWGIDPYLTPSLFDPDAPLRVDFGLDLSARYEIVPGLVLSGTLRQRLLGNRDESTRESTSGLPHVRSDAYLYAKADSPTVARLTAAHYAHPAEDVFTRVTAGYLETMFGGISTEVLWAPLDRRYAVGAEVNYAVQREFDQRFGFQDYDVVTGHLSGYYDIGGGFRGQVDVGRYLAGDWGATFTLDREFENGWLVGGFFTLTDVPFDDFGEGSFDKGIRLSIPLGAYSGLPTRETADFTVRPVLRDGGARIDVDGRLYDVVRDGRQPELRDSWGRFWR